jgi:uncharacterized protein
MPINVTITILPAEAADEQLVRNYAAQAAQVPATSIATVKVRKRSIDARSKQPKVQLSLDLYLPGEPDATSSFCPVWQNVNLKPEVHIMGAGPAGLFAALRLLELGYKPVVLERGKDVRSRRRDLAAMNKQGEVNPESNYCFGEGGAGTYSDGKLYTRSHKRGDINKILQIFHHFGASADILVDAHPHIGTNKLPQIITAMRELIAQCGGEVHFDSKVVDVVTVGNKLEGIMLAGGQQLRVSALLLATGHSARDVYHLLHQKGIALEFKPFALGVRIEHPQQIIDQAQYHCSVRDELLPPASYSLVSQEQGRGVFSFCMCPGGIIAPAATAAGEVVVNGWSPSKRNNPFANSGTVVAVNEIDFKPYQHAGALAGLLFQQAVEQRASSVGGGHLVAPAQRLVDFAEGRVSSSLPSCSYLPGISSAAMADVLPKPVEAALRAAVVTFGKRMKGYYTNEAVLVATESRTSAPVRIPRDKDTLMHTQLAGLFPCAEGAGYAGGIVSAAIDGERCAEAIVQYLTKAS